MTGPFKVFGSSASHLYFLMTLIAFLSFGAKPWRPFSMALDCKKNAPFWFNGIVFELSILKKVFRKDHPIIFLGQCFSFLSLCWTVFSDKLIFLGVNLRLGMGSHPLQLNIWKTLWRNWPQNFLRASQTCCTSWWHSWTLIHLWLMASRWVIFTSLGVPFSSLGIVLALTVALLLHW